MSKKYECGSCDRVFEEYHNYQAHKPCGVSTLDRFGVDTSAIGKVEDNDFTQEKKDSRQIDLETTVVGDCPKCGSTLTAEDRYRGLPKYVECPNCEKVSNVNML